MVYIVTELVVRGTQCVRRFYNNNRQNGGPTVKYCASLSPYLICRSRPWWILGSSPAPSIPYHPNLLYTQWSCKKTQKQEFIPVGCVPAARWPYAEVCFPGGSAPGGCLLPRGCLLGGCLLEGVSAWGVSAPGGGVYPTMHWGRHPSPPVDRHTLVKILPWPNFAAAGNELDLILEISVFVCEGNVLNKNIFIFSLVRENVTSKKA